ncbi:unnamed protein product [Symbiodinium natans]|uniref:Uncharacterized protein n=1 Tax=Symbiodinium natans TaxID=878477 RepID=A0A812UDU3_9DINO|nr:unnamed protein product [Symbiodinium natans]
MPGLGASIHEVLFPPKAHSCTELLAAAASTKVCRLGRRALWSEALPSARPLRTAFEVDRDNAPALAGINGEDESEEPAEDEIERPPMWENLDGLPEVKVTSPAVAYFSKDIGSSEDGEMKPTFGCKCGGADWRPAMSHPSITFRQEFIDLHPDFLGRLRKLKVQLANDNTAKLQWDATYDLRRFLKPGDMPSLTETTPAIAKSGQQLRFLTFCPDAPNNYSLRVTALDESDKPIDYFEDDEMKLNATPGPPPPKEEVTEMTVMPPGQVAKDVEREIVKEPGLETGGQKEQGEEPPEMGDVTREIMKEESIAKQQEEE